MGTGPAGVGILQVSGKTWHMPFSKVEANIFSPQMYLFRIHLQTLFRLHAGVSRGKMEKPPHYGPHPAAPGLLEITDQALGSLQTRHETLTDRFNGQGYGRNLSKPVFQGAPSYLTGVYAHPARFRIQGKLRGLHGELL